MSTPVSAFSVITSNTMPISTLPMACMAHVGRAPLSSIVPASLALPSDPQPQLGFLESRALRHAFSLVSRQALLRALRSALTALATHRERARVLEQEFLALGCHSSASGSPFFLRHVAGSVPIGQTSREPKGNALLYFLDVLGGFV